MYDIDFFPVILKILLLLATDTFIVDEGLLWDWIRFLGAVVAVVDDDFAVKINIQLIFILIFVNNFIENNGYSADNFSWLLNWVIFKSFSF